MKGKKTPSGYVARYLKGENQYNQTQNGTDKDGLRAIQVDRLEKILQSKSSAARYSKIGGR